MCLGLATGYREPTDKNERTYADLKFTHFPEKSGGSGDSIDSDTKGMTNKEIIKAKELIKMLQEAYTAYYNTSKGIPYNIDEILRESAFCLENCLNEIYRQQAEITAITKKLNATIAGQETLQKHILTVETETIKEFAETLKKQFPYSVSIRIIIDTLVNERLV